MQIGINGRFFRQNWRPAADEIAFCHAHGFRAIQFQGKELGLGEKDLGDKPAAVGLLLQQNQITAAMELNITIDTNGKTLGERTPLQVLEANLPAIIGLQCKFVHWHLVPSWPMSEAKARAVERNLLPQFAEAVRLGQEHGFGFGFEHSEPRLRLFGPPSTCADVLKAVRGLQLVWDFNHTPPELLADFAALAPRIGLVHISDTPWPIVNHHLPLGEGTLPLAQFLQPLHEVNFSGMAILEIGGLPTSGGYGRDSDEALIASRDKLEEHWFVVSG